MKRSQKKVTQSCYCVGHQNILNGFISQAPDIMFLPEVFAALAHETFDEVF